MIKQLQGHITEYEINLILGKIKNQYQMFLRLTGSREFTSIFADEYAPHKRQHSVSWAISSAFPSGTTIGDSLEVERLVYGKGHTRPILKNETIELHILNKTTHFDASYLKQRYKYNSDNFKQEKLFAYVKFAVENKRLVSVLLCLPDATGKVVEKETLISRDVLQLIAA